MVRKKKVKVYCEDCEYLKNIKMVGYICKAPKYISTPIRKKERELLPSPYKRNKKNDCKDFMKKKELKENLEWRSEILKSNKKPWWKFWIR